MKAAIFIYEPAHVTALGSILDELKPSETYDLFAYGADIEFLLKEKGITFTSVKNYRTVPTRDRLVYVEQIGDQILNTDRFPFFSYQGISLAKLYVPALQYYLVRLLYHLDIIAAIFEDSYGRAILPVPSSNPGPAAAILEKFHVWAIPDAIDLVCRAKHIEVTLVTPEVQTIRLKQKFKKFLFELERRLFGYMVHVLNVCVRILVPKRKITILASELWKNVSPLMHHLAESELILLDRTESLTIGFKGILRHRIQFLRPNSFITKGLRKELNHTLGTYVSRFNALVATGSLIHVEYRGYSLDSIMVRALNQIVTRGAERTLIEIAGSLVMISRLQPDIVLVRAGISSQTHFAALCEVARLKNVPSIEIQHGILSVFDGDYSKDPSSEYIAEYGPLVRAQLESHNFAPRSHFLDIGSPRFDEYLQHSSNKKVANKYFEILHIGPQLSPGEWNDSYDVFEYFKTMVDAVRGIADAHVTIKLRGGYNDHFFFRKLITELFAGLSYTLVASEPLSTLLEKADVVVSCHSTAYLEALLLGRPVVMDASMPIYRALAEADLEPAREAGALIVAETPAKLKEVLHLLATDISERDTLSARAEQFVLENYLLKDGKSSERLAQAVRVLAGRS